jgi:hypothetical protein
VPSSKTITASRSTQSITNPSGPRPPKKPKLTHPSSLSTPKCKGKIDGTSLQNIPLKQPVKPETKSG